jgi:hypothetical protein
MNDSAAAIVMIVSMAACLVLALRSFRSHNPGFERTALMGVIWAAIIAVLAFVLGRYQP